MSDGPERNTPQLTSVYLSLIRSAVMGFESERIRVTHVHVPPSAWAPGSRPGDGLKLYFGASEVEVVPDSGSEDSLRFKFRPLSFDAIPIPSRTPLKLVETPRESDPDVVRILAATLDRARERRDVVAVSIITQLVGGETHGVRHLGVGANPAQMVCAVQHAKDDLMKMWNMHTEERDT